MAAVGVAVGAASAVIKLVIGQISSTIKPQVKLQWNLSKDLEKMKMTLESVEAVLKDAERQSITDSSTQKWLKRLTDAMYEISDMIDDFEADDIKPLEGLSKKIKMPNKMKKMRKHLEDITEQHKSFSFMRGTSSHVQQGSADRETFEAVEEAKVVGRTDEKQQLMACLSGGNVHQETTFLPIYGIGGIGKTTLAQMVYNDPKFKEYSRVWVYVSQTFDLKKVGNSIISQLSEKEDFSDMQSIYKRLRELFAAKKNILIILDDLWEKDPSQLEPLMTMLKQGEESKVIVMVTTRDEGIAREICTIDPYKLDPLTEEMCWDIIKQKCNFEARPDKEQLTPIGEKIANKCGGVALAAHSLGHMLKSKSYEVWQSVRDSDIWNLSKDTSSTHHAVLTSLSLSYSCMPPYLKLCFGYCGIFPKGHYIVKDDLIHQWIALGFMDPSSTLSTRLLGEDYVKQLMAMSFLQRPKYMGYEDVTLLTMHDLVHDLAKSVMADEVDIDSCSCRYACLTDFTKPLKSSKIRALHFLGHSKCQLRGYASAAKYLRVLDLSLCPMEELPDCVGQLKQLRYLSAPHMKGRMIPTCITKLSKLNYLNLAGSVHLEALPESIGKMKGLTHFVLARCGIKQLPRSFVELRELVHLNLSHCSGVLGIPEALGGLTKLQHLDLSGCSGLTGLPEVICNLSELRYLNLSHCMRSIFDSSSTDRIQSFIDCICTLPNMEHLDLCFNEYRFSIPESASRLWKLNLIGCSSIVEIPERVVKMDCRMLFGLLPHFSVRADDSASSSNLIWLQHVNPDELRITCLENVKSTEEAHNISLSEKQRIEALSLEWTRDEHAERFVEDMELLTELVPSTTLEGFEIRGYNSVSFPDWLMGNISKYLPNLVRVEMVELPNCKSLPPALAQLQNLQKLVLHTMESVEEWNTTYSCGVDGVNELVLPKLEQLDIHYCPKLRIKPYPPRADFLNISRSDTVLTSWAECVSHTGASSSSSAVPISGGGTSSRLHLGLAQLRVEGSEVPLHHWRFLHHLPALDHLTIKHCSDLASSPEITQALSSLKSLTLGYQFQTEPLEWLGELKSLQRLRIEACTELKELHVNTRQLTQLQSLELYWCESMTSLPQGLGELASLEKLDMYWCPAIRSLPESIQQLTNLQELLIFGCGRLSHWCASEENMLKLAHIKQKEIYGLNPSTTRVNDTWA